MHRRTPEYRAYVLSLRRLQPSLPMAPSGYSLGIRLVLSALPAPPWSLGMLRDRAAPSLAEGGQAHPPSSCSGLRAHVTSSLALTLGL